MLGLPVLGRCPLTQGETLVCLAFTLGTEEAGEQTQRQRLGWEEEEEVQSDSSRLP